MASSKLPPNSEQATSGDDRSCRSIVCPTCGTAFEIALSQSLPFCSERCQMVDLGRWLDEELGLPYDGGPSDEFEI